MNFNYGDTLENAPEECKHKGELEFCGKYVELTIDYDNKQMVASGEYRVFVPIKYCPFCGAKLGR